MEKSGSVGRFLVPDSACGREFLEEGQTLDRNGNVTMEEIVWVV